MLQSSSSEKKLVKPPRNCFFGSNLDKKGIIMGHAYIEIHFLGRYNKRRSSAFSNLLFYQNIISFDWVEWCFLSKYCHFLLQQQYISCIPLLNYFHVYLAIKLKGKTAFMSFLCDLYSHMLGQQNAFQKIVILITLHISLN